MIFLVACLLCLPLLFMPAQKARAQCENCICTWLGHLLIREWIDAEEATNEIWIRDIGFGWLDGFFMPEYFFIEHVQRGMRMMADQLTQVGMMQMNIIGAFLDTKHQLETQQIFQQKMAEAHKDYRSSMDICMFGTATRTIEQVARDQHLVHHIMAQHSQDRQLHNINVSGTDSGIDRANRINRFQARHCDIGDNNRRAGAGGLQPMCGASGGSTDRDVDFTRSIYHKLDLGQFKTSIASADEVAVWALLDHLFAHDIMRSISSGVWAKRENQDDVLDIRSIVAKRAVAEWSMHTIIGLRSTYSVQEVDPQEGAHIKMILRRLGMNDVDEIMTDHPSYYSIMYALTKGVTQDPLFYVNLYESPANLLRKRVALQAVGNIQNMDALDSQLRKEMMLAVLLELEVMKLQQKVQNDMNRAIAEGEGKRQ